MKKTLCLAAALMLGALVSAWAGEVRHVVREGDTLYDLARKYYGDASAWERIAAANGLRDQDARRLQVGRNLLIPFEDETAPPQAGPVVPPPAEQTERAASPVAEEPRVSAGAPVAEPAGGRAPAGGALEPRVEKLQGLLVEGNLEEIEEPTPAPRSLMHFHLGLAALAGLVIVQALCLHVAGLFVLERVTRLETLVTAAVADAFLYFGPLFAWYVIAGLGVPPTGFAAAVILLIVIGAFAWGALWVGSRVLSVSVAGAAKLLLVGFMLFAVVLAALGAAVWGIGLLLRGTG